MDSKTTNEYMCEICKTTNEYVWKYMQVSRRNERKELPYGYHFHFWICIQMNRNKSIKNPALILITMLFTTDLVNESKCLSMNEWTIN